MAEGKLRFLCIDGGGVRGLSALFILKQLMEAVNRKNPPKPCNYFDMIGGTSTGGLIAVMLGRLKLDINRCIDVYLDMMDGVFKKERHRIGIKGDFQARFSTDELERSIKKIVVDSGLHVDATMRHEGPDEDECKVFVCAVSAENRDLAVEFTSYTREFESNSELMDNIKIWEACRATSAATTFFEPMKIGRYGQVFLDGATSANNPVQKLWFEAGEIWGPSLETKVQCLVSIGTGKGDVARFGNDAVAVGKSLKAIATETERTANDFRRGNRDLDDRNAYYRFNVEKGLEKVGLEDAKSRTEIATMTQAYMTQGETLKALRQFQKVVTAANAVPYIPPEPRPKAFAFLALDDSPRFLRKDSESYWECVTIDAMNIYETIYGACTDSGTGFVSLEHFHQQFDGTRPRPELISEIWQRIESRPDFLLPKNLTMAVLYMLHMESFLPNREHKPISLNRRKILESFGNWIPCVCGCGRKWSFAGGPLGMTKDGNKTKRCKVTKWEDNGRFGKMLMNVKREPTTDPGLMDENQKIWLRDRQFPRAA